MQKVLDRSVRWSGVGRWNEEGVIARQAISWPQRSDPRQEGISLDCWRARPPHMNPSNDSVYHLPTSSNIDNGLGHSVQETQDSDDITIVITCVPSLIVSSAPAPLTIDQHRRRVFFGRRPLPSRKRSLGRARPPRLSTSSKPVPIEMVRVLLVPSEVQWKCLMVPQQVPGPFLAPRSSG